MLVHGACLLLKSHLAFGTFLLRLVQSALATTNIRLLVIRYFLRAGYVFDDGMSSVVFFDLNVKSGTGPDNVSTHVGFLCVF